MDYRISLDVRREILASEAVGHRNTYKTRQLYKTGVGLIASFHSARNTDLPFENMHIIYKSNGLKALDFVKLLCLLGDCDGLFR